MNSGHHRDVAENLEKPAGPSRSPRSLRDAWTALAGLSAVFLFEMLDNSILNVALPTIGRELSASATALQWVTSAYAVVFGGFMLALGALADRVGRRKVMLVGLVLLGVTSLSTAFVTTAGQLIAVRSVMGVAAAMTTPGSLALAFRLFDDDGLRVRATTLISTVGLVGLGIGPTAGGFVLAFAPWQALLLVNVPIAALAFVGIRRGIPADRAAELHRDPIDAVGALLGTATIVFALIAPTLFVQVGTESYLPWLTAAAAIVTGVLFVVRERSTRCPLLDIDLLSRPLVSSGLAFKGAAGLATAGLGYLVTLQLQLDWGWTPARAALGMLPQVVVLIAGGAVIGPLVERVGLDKAARLGAAAVVCGLVVYGALGRFGYPWVAIALALNAAGMRVVGVVAGTNVMRGLPRNRTTIGAALVDTAGEVTTAIGVAVGGTLLATLFTGDIATSQWSTDQTAQFRAAVTSAGLVLSVVAAALVGWGMVRARVADQATLSSAAVERTENAEQARGTIPWRGSTSTPGRHRTRPAAGMPPYRTGGARDAPGARAASGLARVQPYYRDIRDEARWRRLRVFSVEVRPTGGAWLFLLRGELDYASAVQLEEAAEKVFAEAPRPALIVVDCTALEFCDSSGISCLIRVHLRLVGHGGELRLAAVPVSVARVFSLTGLDQAIPAHSTAPDAVAAGRGAGSSGEGLSAAPCSATER